MKKLILAFISVFLIAFSANAEFFSIKLGDSDSAVEQKLLNAGFRLYRTGSNGDYTFIARNVTNQAKVIGEIPTTEEGFLIHTVTVGFDKNGNLDQIAFSFTGRLCNNELTKKQQTTKWLDFVTACKKEGYDDFIYVKDIDSNSYFKDKDNKKVLMCGQSKSGFNFIFSSKSEYINNL